VTRYQFGPKFAFDPDNTFADGKPSLASIEHGIPGDSYVEYEVELLAVGEARTFLGDMALAEALAAAEDRKGTGTGFFKAGDYKNASRCYMQALRFVKQPLARQPSGPGGEEPAGDREARENCLVACANNAATSLAKEGLHKEAREKAAAALAVHPDYVKALYRRGASALALAEKPGAGAGANGGAGMEEEARAAIRRVLELDPKNAAARGEWAKLQARRQQAKDEKMGFLHRMASGAGKVLYPEKPAAKMKDQAAEAAEASEAAEAAEAAANLAEAEAADSGVAGAGGYVGNVPKKQKRGGAGGGSKGASKSKASRAHEGSRLSRFLRTRLGLNEQQVIMAMALFLMFVGLFLHQAVSGGDGKVVGMRLFPKAWSRFKKKSEL
jgi:tetratricopeptide (TPR) repeat protein